MKIFGIRYFSIKSQETLFGLPDGIKAHDLFLYSLNQQPSVEYYSKTYTTRLIDQTVDDRYIVGYLLKSIDTHLINLDDSLFQEEDVQNWEKLLFVIDLKSQIFACQNDSQIATPENVKNVLEELTNKPIASFGYTIKLEFIADKYKFWSIIYESNGIYSIAFRLNAPNLFGGSKKANAWLKELNSRHNMTTVGFDIENENAALKYDEEELESYRDYADSGGGSWILKVLEGGKKRKYKSEQNLRQRDLELHNNTPKFILDNINSIFEKMKIIIAKLND